MLAAAFLAPHLGTGLLNASRVLFLGLVTCWTLWLHSDRFQRAQSVARASWLVLTEIDLILFYLIIIIIIIILGCINRSYNWIMLGRIIADSSCIVGKGTKLVCQRCKKPSLPWIVFIVLIVIVLIIGL